MQIEFRINGGRLPIRGSALAAGLDIHSAEDGVVYTGGRKLFKTGVYLNQVPIGTYARLAPRSKMANKFGIDVLAGVVDSDYRGEICVVLQNNGHHDYKVHKGDAIAQIIVEKICYAQAVDVTDEVVYSETERGESGINCEDERR